MRLKRGLARALLLLVSFILLCVVASVVDVGWMMIPLCIMMIVVYFVVDELVMKMFP